MSNRSWNKRRATVEQIETGRRRWLGLRGWVVLALIGGGLIVGLWMAEGKTFSLSPDESVSAAHSPSRPPGNQLADAPSPYLREAARQPVYWLPWGQEAFRRAQEEDKPILLDIGAIWCHWCHVMDVESYENEDIAALINRDYVAIKVDRDERPDIDRRYQEAVQGLTGRGGWPLTAFLTPDGKVFFGGTYFPPDNRGKRPGLKTLLPTLAEAYKTRKAEVLASAEQLSTALTRRARQSVRSGTITGELVDAIAAQMAQRFDVVNGGFGTGTKFPAASAIELALARHFVDHDPKLLQIATKTLDAMAQGGVYDQIGGGFFRYSTDPQWRVPHFEKMSYDNAELLVNYLHAYQATGKALKPSRSVPSGGGMPSRAATSLPSRPSTRSPSSTINRLGQMCGARSHSMRATSASRPGFFCANKIISAAGDRDHPPAQCTRRTVFPSHRAPNSSRRRM